MSESKTKERILDAAEVLFAEKGFSETSLRAITSRAGVNLAAVNYHFGSKESLIQAVFERFLTPFCGALSKHLEQMEADGEVPDLERLLSVVSMLAIGSHGTDPRRAVLFFRLSGLAYSQAQGHLRSYLRERYGEVFRRFLRHLDRAVPDVPPREIFWRVHFALGATIFTLSGMDSLQSLYRADFGADSSPADIHARLLSFLVAGIRHAPVPDS